MTSRTLARIAVAAGAALFATVAAASPALADVTGVPINPGNVATALFSARFDHGVRATGQRHLPEGRLTHECAGA